MEDNKKISNFPYDPGYPCDVYFDIGISDQTAIIFTQQIGRALFVIDCYNDSNKSLDFYADYIRKKGYNYPQLCFSPRHRATRAFNWTFQEGICVLYGDATN